MPDIFPPGPNLRGLPGVADQPDQEGGGLPAGYDPLGLPWQQLRGLGSSQPAAWPNADPNDISGSEWAWLSSLLGGDARQQYSEFVKHYVIAVRARDAQGQPGGAQQIWTTGDPDAGGGVDPTKYAVEAVPLYVSQASPGTAQALGESLLGGVTQGDTSRQRPSPKQWEAYILNSTGGLPAVMAMRVAQDYEGNYGEAMPAELRTRIQNAVTQLPRTEQERLVRDFATGTSSQGYGQLSGQGAAGSAAAAGAAFGAGAAGTRPGAQPALPSYLQSIVDDYVAGHPSQGSTSKIRSKLSASRQQQIVQALGVGALTGGKIDLSKIGEMSDDQFAQWLNQQPYAGAQGKFRGSYGDYQRAFKRSQADWNKYFGKDPTDADLLHVSGMNDEQYHDYLMGQPSRVAGYDIRHYESAAKVAQQFYGDSAPDVDAFLRDYSAVVG